MPSRRSYRGAVILEMRKSLALEILRRLRGSG
jgi:hypothetical protein